MEKIFANNTSDKELIYKIYKELIKHTHMHTYKQLNFKIGTGPKQTFLPYKWPIDI